MRNVDKLAECFKVIERRQLAFVGMDEWTRDVVYRHYATAVVDLADLAVVARQIHPEMLDTRRSGSVFRSSVGNELVEAGVLSWSCGCGTKTTIVEDTDNGKREHIAIYGGGCS